MTTRLAHFEQVVKEMNAEKEAQNQPVTLNISMHERINQDTVNRKNFGYAAISKAYHELELDTFFINRQRHLKADYDTNSIMKLLVFERLLDPYSKKKTYEDKDRYFEKTDFSLDDLYRSLMTMDTSGMERTTRGNPGYIRERSLLPTMV